MHCIAMLFIMNTDEEEYNSFKIPKGVEDFVLKL